LACFIAGSGIGGVGALALGVFGWFGCKLACSGYVFLDVRLWRRWRVYGGLVSRGWAVLINFINFYMSRLTRLCGVCFLALDGRSS